MKASKKTPYPFIGVGTPTVPDGKIKACGEDFVLVGAAFFFDMVLVEIELKILINYFQYFRIQTIVAVKDIDNGNPRFPL
jgi:hypothetical protein